MEDVLALLSATGLKLDTVEESSNIQLESTLAFVCHLVASYLASKQQTAVNTTVSGKVPLVCLRIPSVSMMHKESDKPTEIDAFIVDDVSSVLSSKDICTSIRRVVNTGMFESEHTEEQEASVHIVEVRLKNRARTNPIVADNVRLPQLEARFENTTLTERQMVGRIAILVEVAHGVRRPDREATDPVLLVLDVDRFLRSIVLRQNGTYPGPELPAKTRTPSWRERCRLVDTAMKSMNQESRQEGIGGEHKSNCESASMRTDRQDRTATTIRQLVVDACISPSAYTLIEVPTQTTADNSTVGHSVQHVYSLEKLCPLALALVGSVVAEQCALTSTSCVMHEPFDVFSAGWMKRLASAGAVSSGVQKDTAPWEHNMTKEDADNAFASLVKNCRLQREGCSQGKQEHAEKQIRLQDVLLLVVRRQGTGLHLCTWTDANRVFDRQTKTTGPSASGVEAVLVCVHDPPLSACTERTKSSLHVVHVLYTQADGRSSGDQAGQTRSVKASSTTRREQIQNNCLVVLTAYCTDMHLGRLYGEHLL